MNLGNVISVASIAILGLSVTNFFMTFSGSPAFDKSARVKGLSGDWRVGIGAAYYDRPAYLFQLGYGYLNADTTTLGVTEGRDEVASSEVALNRAERAVALFQESLSLDPANAYVWNTLAWARAMTGDFSSARAAMQASWELAPFNSGLSTHRLTFADMLTGPMLELLETPLSEEEIAYIRQDIEVAQRYRARDTARILAGSKALTIIATQ